MLLIEAVVCPKPGCLLPGANEETTCHPKSCVRIRTHQKLGSAPSSSPGRFPVQGMRGTRDGRFSGFWAAGTNLEAVSESPCTGPGVWKTFGEIRALSVAGALSSTETQRISVRFRNQQ